MRIAIIYLPPSIVHGAKKSSWNGGGQNGAAEGADTPQYLEQCGRVEYAQVQGLLEYLEPDDAFKPALICPMASPLVQAAAEKNWDCLPLTKAHGMRTHWRLWKWQRQNGLAAVMAIGEQGLALAHDLVKMRKKSSPRLIGAFFLRYPQHGRNHRPFAGITTAVCGSGLLETALRRVYESTSAPHPDFIRIEPGIDLSAYQFPACRYDVGKHAGHFVFGMAESLLPGSGALLVVRAMSGLWLQDDVPHWEVRMFGSGPRYGEILEEAEKLGVISRLSILSDQPLDVVTRHCHVWLAPGGSLLELPETLDAGFAAGLPVICSHGPLHDERLSGGKDKAVLWINKDNPQDLAQAMLDMMRNREMRESLAEQSARIRESTGVAEMARRIGTVLKRAVQGNCPDSLPGSSSEDRRN